MTFIDDKRRVAAFRDALTARAATTVESDDVWELYRPNRQTSPVDYWYQGILGRHPRLPGAVAALAELQGEFGEHVVDDGVDLLCALCAGQGSIKSFPSGIHGVGMSPSEEVVLLWTLIRPPAGADARVATAVSQAIHHLTGIGSALSPRKPSGYGPRLFGSFVRVIANRALGEAIGPEVSTLLSQVAEVAHARLNGQLRDVQRGHWLNIAQLMWLALDTQVLVDDAARQLLAREPELLHGVSHVSFTEGARLAVRIEEGSVSDRLIEDELHHRLEDYAERPEGYDAVSWIKSCPYWPGTGLLARALALNEGGQTRGRFEGKPDSVSWHVLHYGVRRRSDTTGQVRTAMAGASEQALLRAAIVAPWWLPEIEDALGTDVVAPLVYWTHAHPCPTNRASEAPWPRLRAWVQREVAQHTTLCELDRVAGVIDRDWLQEAWTGLSRGKLRDRLLRLLPQAFEESNRAQTLPQIALGLKDNAAWERWGHTRSIPDDLVQVSQGGHSADLAARYEAVITELTRTDSTAAGRLAGEHAMCNLATAAGHELPMELGLAMSGDHGAPPAVLGTERAGRYDVTLRIEPDGVPVLIIEPVETSPRRGRAERAVRIVDPGPRGGKVPPGVRKVPIVTQFRRMAAAHEYWLARACEWLEARMIDGRPIPARTLIDAARKADRLPIARVCEGIVFEVAGGKAHATFVHATLGPNFAVRFDTIDGEAVTLGAQAALRVAHPHQLEAAGVLQAWRDALATAHRTQPISQLHREMAKPALTRGGVIAVPRTRSLLAPTFLHALAARGWRVDDGSPPQRCFDVFEEQGKSSRGKPPQRNVLVATLSIEEPVEVLHQHALLRPATIAFHRFERGVRTPAMALKQVSAVVASEAFCDVVLAMHVAERALDVRAVEPVERIDRLSSLFQAMALGSNLPGVRIGRGVAFVNVDEQVVKLQMATGEVTTREDQPLPAPTGDVGSPWLPEAALPERDVALLHQLKRLASFKARVDEAFSTALANAKSSTPRRRQ